MPGFFHPCVSYRGEWPLSDPPVSRAAGDAREKMPAAILTPATMAKNRNQQKDLGLNAMIKSTPLITAASIYRKVAYFAPFLMTTPAFFLNRNPQTPNQAASSKESHGCNRISGETSVPETVLLRPASKTTNKDQMGKGYQYEIQALSSRPISVCRARIGFNVDSRGMEKEMPHAP
ncbi:MAG: hypothetical protein MZU79_03900 [Anaerotruncus sp.]|nr:hypothetical protein [Anaerotruncus sp.]